MSLPIQGENDNRRASATVFGASRLSLFLPTLVVLVGYGLLLLVLSAAGHAGGPIARICLIVLIVGVPVIAVYAALRAATLGVRLEPHALVLLRGFPARRPVLVPWQDVAEVSVVGRFFARAGTLVVEDVQGTRTAVHDLKSADEAAILIRARIGRFQGVAALLDGLSAIGRRGSG
jgi:hypothetical protein